MKPAPIIAQPNEGGNVKVAGHVQATMNVGTQVVNLSPPQATSSKPQEKEASWNEVPKKSAAKGTQILQKPPVRSLNGFSPLADNIGINPHMVQNAPSSSGHGSQVRESEVGIQLHAINKSSDMELEHKVHQALAGKLIKKIVYGWQWRSNYNSVGRGRIWVLWDPSYIVYTEIASTEQFIHGSVLVKDMNIRFLFTSVYGLHTIEDRKPLWCDLGNLSTTIQGPWLIIGDFNTITRTQDRINGSEMKDLEVRDFRKFIFYHALSELLTDRRLYAWSNGTICSKIDRALINAEWMLHSPFLNVTARQPLFSDHSPMCLEIERHPEKVARHFKFFNCLARHGDFLKVVATGWNTQARVNLMERVWRKLKATSKRELKQLNTKEFNDIASKFQLAKDQLLAIQEQIKDGQQQQLLEQEKELRKQFEKWTNIEESVMPRKSRIQWLKLGDSNTAYFHANLKSMETLNYKIRLLVNADGEGDYVLNRTQQLMLIEPIIDKEIWQAMKDIDDLKAIGIDGFNAVFFQKAWTIVGEEISAAIIEFFDIQQLYNPMNCANVILIPKARNLTTIKNL
ncbi:uncharacterized protein LOC132066131 [Lycium ferocissimum]|uniref:uncharacterized protein LOC132066131 n=1 Tax=Lycium ferocissimum TaxID=112874 RepID=UPI002814D229|nr:uncharacterized protein LOC132066131 [Lycium ferocissimum]